MSPNYPSENVIDKARRESISSFIRVISVEESGKSGKGPIRPENLALIKNIVEKL